MGPGMGVKRHGITYKSPVSTTGYEPWVPEPEVPAALATPAMSARIQNAVTIRPIGPGESYKSRVQPGTARFTLHDRA